MANASALDAPLEALFDRTAVLDPSVTVFATPGAGQVYTIPALTKWIEIVAVGGGGRGGNTPSGYQHAGAGGGGSGEVVRRVVPASLLGGATQLSVEVGAGADSPAGTAGDSRVSLVAADIDFRAEGGSNGTDAGNTSGGAGGAGGTGNSAGHGSGSAAGGAGSDAASGLDGSDGQGGHIGRAAAGGAHGGLEAADPGAGGSRGQGYGAGGGGSGGGTYNAYADGAGGGGGGGGGFGVGNLAGSGQQGAANVNTPAYGGPGADGIVVIIAWRGAP